MPDIDFLKESSKIFRLWKNDKKSLCDMTDSELTSFEEYLRLYFLASSSGGSLPSAPAFDNKKLFKSILLFISVLLVLFFLFVLK